MGILARLLPGNFTILTFELKKYIKNSVKSDYLAGKNTLFQAVHMSDVMMVNLGSDDWPEKRVMTAAHPVPLSNVIAPGVFTSIYLKLITSYYAHILLIAMLYFDRIIQDLQQTKQKYVYI